MRPLLGGAVTPQDRRFRLAMFVIWLALVAWFLSAHVFWRDEVRAFSLALSGSNYIEMLRNVHGEGHPALWYLILRGAHDIFPYREVLPAAGAVIGIAAMAVLTFFSPFRAVIIALVLFSFYGAFEYVVIARNYGISALVMLTLAALYSRVRNSLWFGFILVVLCNTNVPSCILAAGFLLFRFVEMLTEELRPAKRDWIIFGGNALLAAIGAYICFRTVYPTFNDAAVSRNLGHINFITILQGLADSGWGFSRLGFSGLLPLPLPLDFMVLGVVCLAFVRSPAGLAASVVCLVTLKLFFYFVYYSYYRHEVLYLFFLLSLFWMIAEGRGGRWRERHWYGVAQSVGIVFFVALLVMQTSRLVAPIRLQMIGLPFSRSADVAALLKRPELSGAIVMGDPDTMLEPLAYYADNPIWFLRQQRFGHVVQLSSKARHELSLTDILADAEQLHARTGRPILILSHLKLQDTHSDKFAVMFRDTTVLRPDEVRRFWASTRLVAKLRPAASDEEYDAYVYPR